MILLNPDTSPNTVNIILRDELPLGNVTVTIRDEASQETESLTVTPDVSNDNYIVLSCPFTILVEDRIYEFTVVPLYTLPSDWIGPSSELYRGKAYSTSNTDTIHTINTDRFTTNTANDSQTFKIHE